MKTIALLLLSYSLCFAQVAFKTTTTNGPRPWTHLEFNKSSDQFQFAIVADRTGGHRPGVFEDGVRKLNLLQPEFVITVGDLIEGYTTDKTVLHKEWDEFDGFVEKLEMPFFYVPGNHDYINKESAEVWEDRYGPDHYYFLYNDVLFLCLNSEEMNNGSNKGSISPQQYEWAKKVLEKNAQAKWTLVFMHQPLWDQEKDSGSWFELEEELKERKHTVFVGHRHNYAAYERNNTNYYILATTGGGSPLKGPQLGQFDHFAWVTMTNEGPVIANLALDGIYDDKVITIPTKERIAAYFKESRIAITEWTQAEQELEITLRNPYDFPIEVGITPKFSWNVNSDVNINQVKIQPNSVEKVWLQLLERKGKTISKGEELVVQFKVILPKNETLPKVHFPITKTISLK